MRVFDICEGGMPAMDQDIEACICICIFTSSWGPGHGGPLPDPPTQEEIDDNCAQA